MAGGLQKGHKDCIGSRRNEKIFRESYKNIIEEYCHKNHLFTSRAKIPLHIGGMCPDGKPLFYKNKIILVGDHKHQEYKGNVGERIVASLRCVSEHLLVNHKCLYIIYLTGKCLNEGAEFYKNVLQKTYPNNDPYDNIINNINMQPYTTNPRELRVLWLSDLELVKTVMNEYLQTFTIEN